MKDLETRTPSHISSTPSRLWRPAAQRNIRNKWSQIFSSKARWFSASSEGRSHATALVNAYLSWRYMPEMNLGELKEMPEIRSKACNKLYHKHEQCSAKLLSSYKGMVIAAIDLVKASGSMRCYLRGSGSSSIIKYSDEQEDPSDHGDGGGIPVFSCFSISIFEDLARELVKMFLRELSLKRFLVMDLLSSTSMDNGRQEGILSWSDELYTGEFNDLQSTGMLVQDGCYLSPPQIMDWQSSDLSNREPSISPSHEVFQVYLTTWLADLNIEMHRVGEIFSVVEDAIGIKLS